MDTQGRALFWTLVTAAVLGTVAFLVVSCRNVEAHDWYTGLHNEVGEVCCGGSDCAAVDDQYVTPTKGGYEVRIPDFKGRPIFEFVPNARAKPAKEGGQYHLCYWGGEIRCFFYPAPSY